MPAITGAKITLKDSRGVVIGEFHPHRKPSENPVLLLEEIETGKKAFLGVGKVRKFDRISEPEVDAEGFTTYFGLSEQGLGEFLVLFKGGFIDKMIPTSGARWMPQRGQLQALHPEHTRHVRAAIEARERAQKTDAPMDHQIADLHERMNRILHEHKYGHKPRKKHRHHHLPKIHADEAIAFVKMEAKEAATVVKKEAKEHPWILTMCLGGFGLLLGYLGMRQRKRGH